MRRPGRWIVSLVAVSVTGVVGTGCGKDGAVQPTMTKEQAAAQVVAVAQEAFARLPTGAQLKPERESRNLACDDATDGGPAGRTFVEARYAVVHPPGWPVEQALSALADYWQQQKYRIVRDDRDDTTNAELVVERPDGFRISVLLSRRTTGTANASLTSSSPCVWENGTPNPR